MSGTVPDQVIVRKRAAHTQQHLRRIASWQRSALAAGSIAIMLILLSGSSAAVTASTPDQVGVWSAPVAWPLVAVHMSLEPTGLVFMLDGFAAGPDSERLWDPVTGTFLPIPYGRNLFCAGHVQLADGRTLVVGGHIDANLGLADTTIFNPRTKSYFRGTDMSVGRWYPTATVLPDGRVLAFSGDNIVQDRSGATPPLSDASVNSLPSIYNPKTNSWTDLTSARLTSPLYPFMFVLSNGRVFDAGPDTTTRTLDPGTSTWTTVGTSPIDGMSAVMYRPNKIMKSGSWADPDWYGSATYNAGAGTAVIDMGATTPAWRSTAPMAFGRSYQNLTLLPDGTVLASGGMSTSDGTDLSKAVLPAEIWNPDTETWTTVESLHNGREYHSTAMLLPDGRVLMAGGGQLPGRATNQTNAEIYSPPYLFKGARPTISSAPASASYASSFDVATPNASQIAKVSLIRSPSVTHAIDMNQRFQFLNFTTGTGKVTVTAPANANLAPPGDYLLYVVDTNGVPSVGSFITISAAGDTTAPSAPSNLTGTGGAGQATLSWSAATDNVGVVRYNVHRSTTTGFTPSAANLVAQPTSTSFLDAGLTAATYYYKVTAEDDGGNVGLPSNEASAAVSASSSSPGLVAAWGFDAGSGTTAVDQSGKNNVGTLSSAAWSVAGKYGGALAFNGGNSYVSVADSSSLDLTTGMTIEGWVKPTSGGGWQTLLVKERPGQLVYGLYANNDSNKPQSQITIAGTARLLNGASAVPAGLWTHLAATFDGTTQRLYVNGTQVAQLAASGTIDTSDSPLKIGGNAIWGEWFDGLIDEVRVYNRALGASEIQTDMNTPISNPDTVLPGAPGTLTATGGLARATLAWGAASDNVGVVRYNLHRSSSSGFIASSANRIAQPTGTSYTDTGLAAGTYYYKVTAEDAAGNIGTTSNEASAVASTDTTPPTAPSGLVATGSSGQAGLAWSPATDVGGVVRYNVHRATSSGFTPSVGNRVAQPTGTSYTDTGLTAGTYFYKVTAEDAAGNIGPASNEATATVTAPATVGLVAAYGFDEGSGATSADQSGNGNTGTLANTTWAGASTGRYGNALSFNGTNSLVSVAHSSSLNLTTAVTMEAWVRPTTVSGWRTVALKERTGYYGWGMYASTDSNRPSANIYTSSDHDLRGTAQLAANTWTHLATTYDGTVIALYVNGTQAATVLASGQIISSTGSLRIGGNTIWGEYFNGLIDEVRIYNRALNATEIQTDMNRPVTNPDSTPPSAPGTLTATGGLAQATLSWGAATDNTGIARYNLHRATTAGFTPTTANRIAQPTTTTYTDTGLTPGTYYYKVTAEDTAGNTGPTSNEATAVVGDMASPSPPGTLSATGGVGKATLGWGAASDNVGVVRYNVHRATSSGFTPSVANRVAQPTGTSYTDTGLTAGTYYYKVTAEDAAGNIGPPSNEASAAATTDTSPPSAPTALAVGVSGSSANLTWTASSDDVGVVRYNVHRATTSGFTPSVANRVGQPTGTSYSDAGLAVGTYYYKVTAEDAAGNIGAASNEATGAVLDATAPSAPTGLATPVVGSTVNATWAAATDNVGVVRYNVHRGTSSGFTPSAANRVGQPTGTSYSDAGLAVGTYYYKVTAEDAAGNISAVSNTSSATVLDTTAPGAPGTLSATGGAGQSSLSWATATDDVGVVRYNVHRATSSGFTPSVGNRVAQPTGTSYTDTGLTAGTYFYKVTAEDAAGNIGPASNEATATVTAPATVGLVAAYGFDEGSGATSADQSGNGNTGTLANTTWAGASTGRYGNALSFNGTNSLVSVAHSSSLNLTTAVTMEAWVRPTTVSGWRTVALKERTGYYGWGMYASTDSNRPSANIYTSSDHDLRGTAQLAANTWTHLATTYDGTVIALYVNGTQAATVLASGQIISSTGSLRIGGNTIWGEYFNGLIDEVRIYNRALNATEIQTDMNRPVTNPDSTPPSAPGTLTATGGLAQATLSWGAATDNTGIARYNLHRATTAGFTPTTANRIAQPTTTTYTDTGLTPGTYYYKVTAEDTAGNTGPTSNEATAAATADTTPPTVSMTAPTLGTTVSGMITVSANASDNGVVAGVQFKLDGVNLGAEDTSAPYSISWDTLTAANGSHNLSAAARDGAGNIATATSVPVTVSNTLTAGLVGAWAFDESGGTTAADQSGKANNGTVSNATWTTGGKFNNGLSFNGTNSWVTVPDSATLDLTSGMTVEAWVKPGIAGNWRTAVVKEQTGNLVYGIYANTSANGPEAEVYVGGSTRSVTGPSALPVGVWSHLAATYDGTTLRLFVGGAQVAQLAAPGSITTSNSPVRIGGNNVWSEWFSGAIDEVRIYNRALSVAEIQADASRSVTPDTTPPTVSARSPGPGAAGVNVGSPGTVTFSEPMNAGSITNSSFVLRDSAAAVVPASVSYDPVTSVATLTPSAALAYGATYSLTVKGGTGGATDFAGNALAADASWSFTTETSPPQILLVAASTNPFGSYLGEILRNEGLNAFTTIDASYMSPGLLTGFDVVVLGESSLSTAQVTTLTNWVTGGGNLVAMRPDKKLAPLLGLADTGTTLANAYLQVNTGAAPGAGITASTMQFHGTADRYTLSGATAIATLYSNATTPTVNPAATLRSVGSSGGQAAAFTFDLARSVVYTRQGNPAWAGQERDGVSGVRPDDLFFGAKAGDVQPDWLDTSRIVVPQADEQQRLLANLITLIERDKLPLPRFWYLPRGNKAVVVMSGDDHSPSSAPGGTASHFDRFKALSPPGCVVANWECVRATSYILPDSVLSNTQAAAYLVDGFEIALHPVVASCPTTVLTQAELSTIFDMQLGSFGIKYTSVPAPVSGRTHCVYWPDWASNAKVELAHGIRMDANYYHYPAAWIGAKPGFLNGGGFPMRFADLDGTTIDVYQQNTAMDDEASQAYPATVDALLDNALGPQGYYGAFGTNIHNDTPTPQAGAEAIVASAQAHGVPVISYKQLLDWTDGRNNSTIRSLSWNAGTLTFTTTVATGANGLQTMLPTQGPTGTLTTITRNGTPVPYTLQTIKGTQYALFTTATATYQATYT